jgi:hypothetical protein
MRKATDRQLGRVRDGADDACQTPRRGQSGALRVDHGSARLARKVMARSGVVDHEACVAHDRLQRARNGQGLVLPEHRPVRIDHAGGRHERTGRKTGDERPGKPERDESAFGQRKAGLETDPSGSRTPGTSGPFLDGERAGERELVGGLG